MEVPFTKRREDISRLFGKSDYEGIVALGNIRLVSGPEAIDCGNHVLHELNIPASLETANVVWTAPNLDEPPRGRSIILYRLKGKPNVLQHGFYDSRTRKVTSRWGPMRPVFEHDIWDVPIMYGNEAKFVEINDALMSRLQAMVPGQRYD